MPPCLSRQRCTSGPYPLAELARQRYLQRHIEPGLPHSPQPPTPWRHALVIPAYREDPELARRLRDLPTGPGRTLVILVLNRPDSDPDPEANAGLRAAVAGLPNGSCPGTRELNASSDLYLWDLDLRSGPLPAARGVGLARKIGCDIAFRWMCEGAISGRWVCSTDADSMLPPDYFRKLEAAPAGAVAATYPFWHGPGEDASCNLATALYELRMHHYVLGLEYAGSPYDRHTLGSCLAVRFDGYARVHGFPRRSGGEDFYLLNKLAKTGPVARLGGDCILLASRQSRRAPFGTGPAVTRIMDSPAPQDSPLFYHPACFVALRCLLAAVPSLAPGQTPAGGDSLAGQLRGQGLAPELSLASARVLQSMGIEAALAHCRRQGKAPGQFTRQFLQWFDGFRTLKFIHGLRSAGWQDQSLAALGELQPNFWPSPRAGGIEDLRGAVLQHWGWTVAAPGG